MSRTFPNWVPGTLARLAAVALLALAMVNPSLPLGERGTEVVLLLDDSQSIDRAIVDERWRSIWGSLNDVAGDRARIIRFAAIPVLEPTVLPTAGVAAVPPRTRQLDGRSTDIAGALTYGLRYLEPGQGGILVLATDGDENVGQAAALLADARDAGVTVLGVDLRSGAARPRLVDWRVPGRARLGQTLNATAYVAAGSAANVGIELIVDQVSVARNTLSAEPGRIVPATFRVDADTAGPMQVGFRLTDATGAVLAANDVAAIVDVLGPPAVLYVTENPQPALARSLRAGGFAVDTAAPARLTGRAERFARYHAIVLDDIGAHSLTTAAQQGVGDAVAKHGTGLVVLGGENSFGAGAYRQSILESLLPVTAQPPNQERAVAVSFLVDNSGSMGQAPQGTSRLEFARAAVLETAQTLTASDRISLHSFNVESATHLAAGHYADPRTALANAWQFGAQGGTQLAPALERALASLTTTATGQKILILVTDGFVEDTDLAYAQQILADHRIDLIAMAIGAESDIGSLQALADAYRGRVLRVEELAELPRLMRNEVETSREPVLRGERTLITSAGLPPEFPSERPWPDVRGLSLVRARDDAQTHVTTVSGEPVLVEHVAGAGRVLVFTPGIGHFTAEWPSWPDWPRFAGALVERVSPLFPSARLGLDITDDPERIILDIDVRGEAGDWQSTVTPAIRLRRPDGTVQSTTAEPIAPGRFRAQFPATANGVYTFNVEADGATLRKLHLRSALQEQPVAPGEGEFDVWVESGLLQSLNDAAIADIVASNREPARKWLVAAALTILLLTWISERLWIAPRRTVKRLRRIVATRLKLVRENSTV
jgi:uncharacterized membrane protein